MRRGPPRGNSAEWECPWRAPRFRNSASVAKDRDRSGRADAGSPAAIPWAYCLRVRPADWRRIEPLDGFGIGADRIFRDEHGGKAVLHRERDGVLDRALQMVGGPVFHQPPNGARTQKRGSLYGNAHTLRDLDDGPNVIL